MLYFALKKIELAEGSENLKYVFNLDIGFNHTVLSVIRGFKYFKNSEIRPKKHGEFQGHKDAKQSYNLLEGYLYCAQRTDDLVYMIEDDIMVSNDFFKFHEHAHMVFGESFCSIAVKNPNRKIYETENCLESIYATSNDYCSLGVCFNKEIINKYIAPHINKEYFKDPYKYVESQFPKSGISGSFCEQDGLIRRTQMGLDLPIIYPVVPRAYHAGYYGKNRKKYLTGSYEKKKAMVEKIIFDDEQMRLNAMIPEYYEDSRPVNLTIEHWDNLKLIN